MYLKGPIMTLKVSKSPAPAGIADIATFVKSYTVFSFR
jgi:hypothetical protein